MAKFWMAIKRLTNKEVAKALEAQKVLEELGLHDNQLIKELKEEQDKRI